MTPVQIKKKILSYHWEPWLKRPFFGFIISTFCGGNTKEAFKKIELPGWEYNTLWSNGEWYQSKSNFRHAKPAVLKWLKTHSITEITGPLEKLQAVWKTVIAEFSKNPGKDTQKKLKRLDEILREITTYVWATHVAEHFFSQILKTQVTKIVKGDVNKFIGDAAFPSKLNAAEQMVEEYKNGVSPKILAKKYGWMRARDGFADGYTEKEIAKITGHALSLSKHQHPIVPKALEKIVAEARELVYLRMLRMDCYFELMFLARPLLEAAAKKYKIPFIELKFYSLESLIKGKPKKYPANATWAAIGNKIYYLDHPLFDQSSLTNATEIKGNIAQMGYAKGEVKIVMSVKDIPKVKKGDILVTYMTSPNFLPAMKLASAFVTDEGGLTCHAAIVAREMKKPCIIGTRIASKIFKDGDLVEVDANKGIVKKL